MGRLSGNETFGSVSGLPWDGVAYFSTQRHGGSSRGRWASFNLGLHAGDDERDVRANRDLLRSTLPSEPVWLKQVHGTEVLDADAFPQAASQNAPVADAAVTTMPGRVLAIMTADCLPVVLATVDGTVLAAAHAGWRGLAGGILEKTVAALRVKAGQERSDASHIRAWVGPAISQAHFEVGPDVFDAFTAGDAAARMFFAEKIPQRKWHADLAGLARHRLFQAGVDTIELSGHCTFAREDLYYSYRRDPHTGRMATLAWIKPQNT
ncbi:peptidoglycan editing factor PgeF [Parapusillimonas sp. JC17]|uniref:peptidoglycan editing factor PgeF n=1 Tax=Parapusillimonas sp. JC17 TaxID=3445768 RepID=UPI003FA0428E